MESENKTIAKNSIFLYARTFLIMIVSLYTVRVTLKILGFVDYGIYNTVGGVIAVFAFMSTTLTSVSQRYFSFYLGKSDPTRLRQYFNSLLAIYGLISLAIAIIAEAVGVWFIKEYLTIPEERLAATLWVYHFSVLTLIIGFIQIPYNSVIISREKMAVYAYISIFEVILKLAVVFLLLLINFDSLVLYSIFLFVVSILKLLFYALYSANRFPECKLMLFWNKATYKELGRYLGWNTIGVFSAVAKTQGAVFILNSFFGPVVNAAYAVANQISSAVNQFVSSFLLAVQPQIVKKYAEGNIARMYDFIYLSSKYSFFLLLIVAIPCIIELPCVLDIWLGDYPEYTVGFSRILVFNALLESLCIPLVTSIQATGNIKSYNIAISLILLLSIPLSILAIKLGMDVYAVLYISIIITAATQILRIFYMVRLTGMPITDYCSKVLMKILVVSGISVSIPVMISLVMEDSIRRLILISISSVLISVLTIYILGMQDSEKQALKRYLKFSDNGTKLSEKLAKGGYKRPTEV